MDIEGKNGICRVATDFVEKTAIGGPMAVEASPKPIHRPRKRAIITSLYPKKFTVAEAADCLQCIHIDAAVTGSAPEACKSCKWGGMSDSSCLDNFKPRPGGRLFG